MGTQIRVNAMTCVVPKAHTSAKYIPFMYIKGPEQEFLGLMSMKPLTNSGKRSYGLGPEISARYHSNVFMGMADKFLNDIKGQKSANRHIFFLYSTKEPGIIC